MGVAPAQAKSVPNPAYEQFKYCPAKAKGLHYCLVAKTLGGEVKLGSKSVPITKPMTVQGGISKSSEQLVPATEGQSFVGEPEPVPGGLAGIEGLEGVAGELSARSELAGPPSSIILSAENTIDETGTAVELPLKVKLENTTLGETCEIGSDASPILLHLTTGTTSPPSPNSPIKGSHGTLSVAEEGNIVRFTGTKLVDNAFSAPEAKGCGGLLESVIDPVVNLDSGLPSASGNNTAILEGTMELAIPKAVRKAHVLPKS
ncbi:MAG TPA: hypothetical protein VMA83_04240 [Solirubrobacteraceae bacterium]|nr:hypothetical protein [Solirubrobacteraceae bacterium]